jgi:DNA-binding CsgD family transcriptional regulator/PAS domain-containing protein
MREDDYRGLTEVVGDIYDAALNPALWADVVARIVEFVGGQAGGLALKDSMRKDVNVYYDVGFDPHYIQVYLETYSKFDPLATAPLFDAGKVAGVPDLMPFDDYLRGRFYQEWARPQGWLDSANAVIEKSGTSGTLLRIVTNKTRGLVDAEMRGRMALVVPHVRRAALIGKSVDLKDAQAAMLAETLDGLSAGLFLVDARGRVVHANTAAREILTMDDFLHLLGGRLVTGDARVNQALRDAFALADKGDAALGIRGIAFPLIARDGDRYVAHVLPLSSGARRSAGVAYTAAAAVFVRKMALQAPSSSGAIAGTFKLTPTELQVLLAIVEVGGAPDVAEALGVAESTVKTHLKRLYHKTGASRQADLVKLVAGFSNPFTD